MIERIGTMTLQYTPAVGDIIKMRSWHGVVLDIYTNEAGKAVLQVQTIRNIFRKLGPELIQVDIAPEHITPATLEDLQREVAVHQEMQKTAIKKLLDPIKQTADVSIEEDVIKV
jgi:hypothetical protein